ncbi:tyramine oxidase, partial [Rhizobium ruizarguesonis]
LWHSFGHTHVCKPEDFPIMPVEYAVFTLKPNGFFASNIAMDLPPEGNSQSVDNLLQRSLDDTGNGSLCHV